MWREVTFISIVSIFTVVFITLIISNTQRIEVLSKRVYDLEQKNGN